MRKILLLSLITLFFLTGCTNNQNIKKQDNSINKDMTEIKVIIDEKEYNLSLEENETTKEFVKMLPQEFKMKELNGNEKYIYLDKSLPTDSYNPDQINKGDVMLFGDNCLVVFYKSFNTNYSYTKIGHIESLPDLDSSSIIARFIRG
ncbi:MAG: hypothetical protein IKE75_06120 [Bacilli bacterium]|nr:hypothetical protein [Bacilli bacterium]